MNSPSRRIQFTATLKPKQSHAYLEDNFSQIVILIVFSWYSESFQIDEMT